LPSNGYIRHNIMLLKSNYFFRIVNYVGDWGAVGGMCKNYCFLACNAV
jgi:hypothetical protein